MSANPISQKPLIIVADDSAVVTRMVKDTLEAGAFTVLAVETGADALVLVGQVHPDLVLLDLYMPGLDGLEVCRRLRADPTTHALPIVLFSGQSSVRDRVTGLRAGADGFMIKEYNLAELPARITRVLQRLGRLPLQA
jgi:two-component system phosphate regulon response regulator PhoB